MLYGAQSQAHVLSHLASRHPMAPKGWNHTCLFSASSNNEIALLPQYLKYTSHALHCSFTIKQWSEEKKKNSQFLKESLNHNSLTMQPSWETHSPAFDSLSNALGALSNSGESTWSAAAPSTTPSLGCRRGWQPTAPAQHQHPSQLTVCMVSPYAQEQHWGKRY